MKAGIATSTEKTYSTAQRSFLSFCQDLNLSPLPATEDTLILYVTHLAQTKVHSTIRTYLAGVRHLHIINGLGNPLEGKLRLELVLKGINRVKPRQSCPRLPVTPTILEVIRQALLQNPGFNSTMLWAACCMGFFGFMRSGEFTVPSAAQFDPKRHLTTADLTLDSPSNPSTVAVTLRFSKTDQFGRGTIIYLGRTGRRICPVEAIHRYLAVRPPSNIEPLFITDKGRPLTKLFFMEQITGALTRSGIDSSRFKGHSFRIGAATTAAACGLSEDLIKTLGRWSSSAYQTYIRIPPSELANISATLVNPT